MSETGPQSPPPDEALLDLLIKQATEGLSPDEQRALDALDSAVAAEYLRDFELAAAAITLAGTQPEAPPAGLRERLEREAAAHFATAPGHVVSLDAARLAAAPIAPVRLPVMRRSPRGAMLGWFAAAACLVLAVLGWLRTPEPVAPPVTVMQALPPEPPPPVPTPPTLAEQRQTLMANGNSLKITLGATKDPVAKDVTGDVVWDPATQQGFLHFAGLAANDPTVSQYQVWIFDGERDKKYPVDGGVFDVPAGSTEIVIPIRATLPIRSAKAFAVTVEKPGGVVVSGLGHVVALGAAG